MELFDFDYHEPVTEYPEDGTSLQLGNSYVYTTAPTAPPQRKIVLYFDGMYNYWDKVNNVPDLTKNPKQNFARLEAFYGRHRMHSSFEYVHPQYGLLVVKFSRPLQAPRQVKGSPGELQGFSVELTEQP